MRQITVKYGGECRACGEVIDPGESAIHEKRVGLFCIGCEPADGSDELREYRQQAIDQRADKLEERAAKRRAEAAGIYERDQHLMSDIAFTTQPGHIPERDRIIKRREKAGRLSAEADALEGRAQRTRARVKGDAAQRDEQRREFVREWIEAGMRVRHSILGPATVEKVNRKTARVRLDSTGNSYAEDLIFLSRADEQAA